MPATADEASVVERECPNGAAVWCLRTTLSLASTAARN